MKIRSLKNDESGSMVPLLLYVITIFSIGALYSLFFVAVGFPSLRYLIPESDSKTFILMGMYAIPLFVLIVCTIALLKEGLKRDFYYPPMTPGGF